MDTLETLQAKYQEIQDILSSMQESKNGKSINEAVKIDREMDKFRDERYNTYIKIQNEKVKNSHICEYFPQINPKTACMIVDICKKEGKENAIKELLYYFPSYNPEWFAVIYGMINS